MPKFIGRTAPPGHYRIKILPCNYESDQRMVRLSYSQACLMPDGTLYVSLDTTDKGSKGRHAKRRYRWFVRRADVLHNHRSTIAMKRRAEKESKQ